MSSHRLKFNKVEYMVKATLYRGLLHIQLHCFSHITSLNKLYSSKDVHISEPIIICSNDLPLCWLNYTDSHAHPHTHSIYPDHHHSIIASSSLPDTPYLHPLRSHTWAILTQMKSALDPIHSSGLAKDFGRIRFLFALIFPARGAVKKRWHSHGFPLFRHERPAASHS